MGPPTAIIVVIIAITTTHTQKNTFSLPFMYTPNIFIFLVSSLFLSFNFASVFFPFLSFFLSFKQTKKHTHPKWLVMTTMNK